MVISEVCENTYGNDLACETWAGRNLCMNDVVWMKENCAKACAFCKGEARRTTTPPSTQGKFF